MDPISTAQSANYFNYKDVAAAFQNWAQVVALGCAAAFFGIKAYQGWFSIDLQLDLQLLRKTIPEGTHDYLTASVTVKRGTQGTLRMNDAVARFTYGNRTELRRIDIDRFGSKQEDRMTKIDLSKIARSVPTLNLAPGDVTCLSTYAVVAREEPCQVDVVFLGYKFGSLKRGQWRASAVSLPLASRGDLPMGG